MINHYIFKANGLSFSEVSGLLFKLTDLVCIYCIYVIFDLQMNRSNHSWIIDPDLLKKSKNDIFLKLIQCFDVIFCNLLDYLFDHTISTKNYFLAKLP